VKHEESEYYGSVQTLAGHMVDKLEKNSHKGRWENLNPIEAFKLLLKESAELLEAVHNGYSVMEVWREAADVANFALMMAENYEKKYEANRAATCGVNENKLDSMGREPGHPHYGVPF